MPEIYGKVFSIIAENQPLPGCTVSRDLFSGHLCVMSLAENTDISPESYPSAILLLNFTGILDAYAADYRKSLQEWQGVLIKPGRPFGLCSQSGSIFGQIIIKEDSYMNDAIKAGEVFSLASLVPVQPGKIVNMDLFHNDKMKFMIMSFADGTGLPEHAAPGEALVFALQGKAEISYEGKAHEIKAGENFVFAKNGRHAIKAKGEFKMALLLML